MSRREQAKTTRENIKRVIGDMIDGITDENIMRASGAALVFVGTDAVPGAADQESIKQGWAKFMNVFAPQHESSIKEIVRRNVDRWEGFGPDRRGIN